MIAGTVVIEDMALSFVTTQRDEGAIVTYTVSDGMTGEQETLTVHAEWFMIALGIAVDFNGGESNSALRYEQAQSVQPKSVTLRWIP